MDLTIASDLMHLYKISDFRKKKILLFKINVLIFNGKIQPL